MDNVTDVGQNIDHDVTNMRKRKELSGKFRATLGGFVRILRQPSTLMTDPGPVALYVPVKN